MKSLITINPLFVDQKAAIHKNCAVTVESIGGPLSDPADPKVGKIDPGHVLDSAGNQYLYFSSGGYVPLSRIKLDESSYVMTNAESGTGASIAPLDLVFIILLIVRR
jgi:beta-xylosidase